MTSKEVERKLSNVYWLKREILVKESRLAELKAMATHITAVISQTKTFSSNVTSKPENYAIRSYELTLDIEDDIRHLLQEEERATEMIQMLNDPMQRTILTDYHLNVIPLNKLEDKYHYSRSQIYNIRQNAYRIIAEIM